MNVNLKLTEDQLAEKAVNTLKKYSAALKATKNEGDLMEHILPVCSGFLGIDPYVNLISIQSLLKAIAKPSIQKVLLPQFEDEYDFENMIEVITALVDFLNAMCGEQFLSMLQAENLEIFRNFPPESHLEHIIRETENKIKSLELLKALEK